MIRLVGLVIVLVIAFLIWAAKATAGHIADNEDLKSRTVKGESQKVMDKTARGLN